MVLCAPDSRNFFWTRHPSSDVVSGPPRVQRAKKSSEVTYLPGHSPPQLAQKTAVPRPWKERAPHDRKGQDDPSSNSLH